MSSSGLFVFGRVNIRAVGAITEFILLLLTMEGRLSNTVTIIGINAELPDPEISANHTLLARWFLSGIGPTYILFDASVRLRVGIRVRVKGVHHILHDYLEVTILEGLWRKFIKLVGLYLVPLEIIFPDFLLFLEALSDRVAVSNAANNLLLHVLHIISRAFRVRGVLVIWNISSLEKGKESCFTWWDFLDLFHCLFQNSSAGGVWFVIVSGRRLYLILSPFLGLPPKHLVVLDGEQVLTKTLISK